MLNYFVKKFLKNRNSFEVKLAIDEALQNIIRYAYDFDKTKKNNN